MAEELLAAHREGLESDDAEERLATVSRLITLGLRPGRDEGEVNNHVHTRYSFSPYSPASAACHAYAAGLQAVGSVDHDSIGAAGEMVRAAALLGIGGTAGCELRVSFAATPFGGHRLNNPDTIGNAYIVLHGVNATAADRLVPTLAAIGRAREERNRRQMIELNAILAGAGIAPLDYDRDVRPLSWVDRGGSVTERHILSAVARRLERDIGRGAPLVQFLRERFSLTVDARREGFLTGEGNPHFHYDLLGILKSGLVERFFLQPGVEECPPVEQICRLAREIGAIPAYSYLGDVGDSPTGDKKAQRFEDAFLDELFAELPRLGFQAVTYMPPRNTRAQLARVQALAARAELLEISGVDINSSRQSFRCPEVREPEFRHLIESTWALIAHERLSEKRPELGLFHPENPLKAVPLAERVTRYASIARASDPRRPSEMVRHSGLGG